MVFLPSCLIIMETLKQIKSFYNKNKGVEQSSTPFYIILDYFENFLGSKKKPNNYHIYNIILVCQTLL